MKIRLTREFSFEMAHALEGYDGACSQIHGHSYRLFVTVAGVPCDDPDSPRLGMVMDFTEFKTVVNRLIVDRYDHTLVMRDTEEARTMVEMMRRKWERIELTVYQPTCENMVIDFVGMLHSGLPENVELVEVKLYETERSSAMWVKGDN